MPGRQAASSSSESPGVLRVSLVASQSANIQCGNSGMGLSTAALKATGRAHDTVTPAVTRRAAQATVSGRRSTRAQAKAARSR